MSLDRSLIAAFTPTGKLRAAINLGNPILANADPISGKPVGVSIDLAQAFAERLAVELELVVFDAAGKSVEAVREERADIGFFAVDPLRAEGISFSAPYILIEGFYLVHSHSKIMSSQDVDQPQNRVVVGKDSAYDLLLSRELKLAKIVRSLTSPTVVQEFLQQNLEVAAGVKQQLQADAEHLPGLRLLNERFMVIHQAMGLPKTRGNAASAALRTFVEDMKASGFISASLDHHRIAGASVAPLV